MKEIVIGVVGPERKLKARPMQMLINYLYKENSCFRMTFIDEHVYLTVDVHQWPIVDVLLILYAPPFPVAKVLDYVTKRQVKMVNNLYMQRYMMDRRYVRRVLQRAGVPVPNAVEVDRGNGDWVEWKTDAPDEICVCGKDGTRLVMRKPFVEKPVDTEDHNVYIYYAGGGVRKLFRKTKTHSSQYLPHLSIIRTHGNYVYEQFYSPQQRRDVKVYAVGDNYFHAEARKAPHIDGIVDRDQKGKERRLSVVLTDYELDLCTKVVHAFDQYLLGFDILRTNTQQTFVIDVNGWSLVKNSKDYSIQSACLLARHIESLVTNDNTTTTSSSSLFDPNLQQNGPCVF